MKRNDRVHAINGKQKCKTGTVMGEATIFQPINIEVKERLWQVWFDDDDESVTVKETELEIIPGK